MISKIQTCSSMLPNLICFQIVSKWMNQCKLGGSRVERTPQSFYWFYKIIINLMFLWKLNTMQKLKLISFFNRSERINNFLSDWITIFSVVYSRLNCSTDCTIINKNNRPFQFETIMLDRVMFIIKFKSHPSDE